MRFSPQFGTRGIDSQSQWTQRSVAGRVYSPQVDAALRSERRDGLTTATPAPAAGSNTRTLAPPASIPLIRTTYPPPLGSARSMSIPVPTAGWSKLQESAA